MTFLSHKELTEVNEIEERLRRCLNQNPQNTQKLTEKINDARNQLNPPSSHNRESARGALFELRMLNQLREGHLGEAALEWPVSNIKSSTSIDLYVPSLDLAVEFQSREQYLVRTPQAPSLKLPKEQAKQYFQKELNASLFMGDVTQKQALVLRDSVEEKSRKKKFDSLSRTAWLLVGVSDTDLFKQHGQPRSYEDYIRELGETFVKLATTSKTQSGAANYLLDCPRVFFAFHQKSFSNNGESIVVFPRSGDERSGASKLADALQLPLSLFP